METKFTLARVAIDNILLILAFGALATWGDIEDWSRFLALFFGIIALTWIVYFVENRRITKPND